MRKKRRPRSYRSSQRRSVKPNFIPVILILCLSVGCGYATAKYVVDPVVNYVPQLTAENEKKTDEEKTDGTKNTDKSSNGSSVVEDDIKVQETQVAGYAVQFGCYSSKAAAESAMSSVGISGLQVIEQNKMYKITGEIFDSKDKAKEALKSSGVDKAFVTTIYK